MALKIWSEFNSCKKTAWSNFFQNKCVIVSLAILVILISGIIATKLWINCVLNELETDSFRVNGTLLERAMAVEADANGLNADQVLKKFMDYWLTVPEDIRKKTTSTFSGFDFQNRPVWILPAGKWDVKGLLTSNEKNEEILKEFTDRALVNMYMSMKLRNANQVVIICDMDQYSYGQLTSLKTIKFLIQMGKKYQPLFEHLAYGFTVNLDSFSRALVAIMQPIMGTESMERIEYFGHDKDKYVPAVLRKISANQLPPEYGGSKGYRPIGYYD